MSKVLQNTFRPEPPAGEWYRWAHNTILTVQADVLPPRPITNLRATAVAGGIQIDFTRSDGDSYTLYKNSLPSTNLSTRIDLGTANTYTDDLGAGGMLRYYLVVSKMGSRESEPSPWVTNTSLGLTVAITPPVPPPATDTPFTDQETDSVAVQVSDHGSYVPL